MPVTRWDAIVVGAGPAGAALACRLRPQHRVLLLDRAAADASPEISPEAAPRIGESLPGAAKILLQRVGAYPRFLQDAHAERAATVSVWDEDTPVWFDPMRDPNGPGWHLDRNRFDAGLRASAVAAGAALREGCGRLRLTRDAGEWCVEIEHGAEPSRGERHRAPWLIDATGRRAAVARQLGFVPQASDRLICLYAHLPANPAHAHDDRDQDRCTRVCADRHGWWYSVRVPSGARVLAFHLDADDPAVKRLRTPDAFLNHARRQPLLAEVLHDAVAAPVHARPAGSQALHTLAQAPPGFFAVGDAMLAFDPIASQGIFNALATAESAARAIERAAAHTDEAARAAFLAEMQAVHARYRAHLHATYAGVTRYRHEPFWARRTEAMPRIADIDHAAV